MQKSNKRTLITILAAILALSLLLTACNNGGDTPTGDNSTPGVSDTQTPSSTPSSTDTMPEDTSEPSNTPSETEPSAPGTSETAGPTTRPTRPDVTLKYDEEKKARVDKSFAIAQNICTNSDIDIDLDEAIMGAFDDYWEYFDERVTYEAFRTALSYWIQGIGGRNLDESNITKMESSSFEKASDFVVSKGGTALDIADPKQNIAAWAIAITLNYQTNFYGMNDPVVDLGASFCFGLFGTIENNDTKGFASTFSSDYYVIIE